MKKGFKNAFSVLGILVLLVGGYAFWQYKSSEMPSSMNMGANDQSSTPVTQLVETP